VLAIIPHFDCEDWLGDCLDSLLNQTRPLDGIVVIDDASEVPPVEIVRQFPSVTLLGSRENVGPYRLGQQVMNSTDYDGYMFQDADDWSLPGRLETLLETAERTGAELVGCQGYRLLTDEAEVVPFTYPIDVNATMRQRPTSFALLHPTSLVSRDLMMRLGGFATGLKFGGDAEFLQRAVYDATVVNSGEFAYVKRMREDALTSAAATGLQSVSRQELHRIRDARAEANADRFARGASPDLAPLTRAGSIELSLLCGPRLSAGGGDVWPR
jgi:glycosyltransferase involved in cell wall biosynthesis